MTIVFVYGEGRFVIVIVFMETFPAVYRGDCSWGFYKSRGGNGLRSHDKLYEGYFYESRIHRFTEPISVHDGCYQVVIRSQ